MKEGSEKEELKQTILDVREVWGQIGRVDVLSSGMKTNRRDLFVILKPNVTMVTSPSVPFPLALLLNRNQDHIFNMFLMSSN